MLVLSLDKKFPPRISIGDSGGDSCRVHESCLVRWPPPSMVHFPSLSQRPNIRCPVLYSLLADKSCALVSAGDRQSRLHRLMDFSPSPSMHSPITTPPRLRPTQVNHAQLLRKFPQACRTFRLDLMEVLRATFLVSKRINGCSILHTEWLLSFKALVTTNETDDSEASNTHQGREPAINWGSTNSPYLSSGLDDPNSSYPYLPPVLEEPTADDDPVPAIKGLQIIGDAFPGRELQAFGYSINDFSQMGAGEILSSVSAIFLFSGARENEGTCTTIADATSLYWVMANLAEEHLPNTLRQALIYQALEFIMPSFAHVSLILAPDRSKLSKRHGATSVGQFREMGYLPKSMVNYLALLGWSDGTGNEFFTMDQLIENFSISRINKSGAMFDSTKLRYLSESMETSV
ncbi:hypothetical protein KSP40_PGU007382 [Platanthera guangdongensis]|uniref:Glutamyl/glutaminyl-tRNA synthetase class Ib catalytic domain-containing protein n=1 Tax=Platanthera guangdongensis TaxID=2320717 RepID=A0ABR2LZT5_9ASPA